MRAKKSRLAYSLPSLHEFGTKTGARSACCHVHLITWLSYKPLSLIFKNSYIKFSLPVHDAFLLLVYLLRKTQHFPN